MQTPVTLCKVGGSTLLPVPPLFLRQLDLAAGAKVGVELSADCLIIKPIRKRKYSLEELLTASNYAQPLSAEEAEEKRQWLDSPPVGKELI